MTIEIVLTVILLTMINLMPKGKNTNLFCGLVGFSGKGKVNMAAINFLLWHNAETRGKHATGIYTPNSGVVKEAEEALKFIKNDNVFNRIKEDNVLIGHVRKASIGSATDSSIAHPFEYDSLVVQHNGTLTNYHQLATRYSLDNNSWVSDSQVLGLILDKNHKANDSFKVLSEYEGAAALLMYNKNTGVIYACHDKERPLFYGHIGEDMYISSIDTSLEIIGCRGITKFPEYKVHTIKEGKIIAEHSYSPKVKPEIKKLAATVLDLITFNFFGKEKFGFSEDNKFTGINHSVPINYIVNYWIKPSHTINASVNTELASVDKTKFYRLTEIIDTHSFRLIDDKQQSGKAYKGNFDLDYFIPIKGNKVTILDNKDYPELVLNKSYEVSHHRFGDAYVIIQDDDKKHIAINILHCRVSTVDEVDNLHIPDELEESKVVNFTIITDNKLEEKESEKEIIEDAVIVQEDEDEIPTELDILQSAVDELLILIEDEFNQIVSNPRFQADEETSLKLIKLDAFITECHDYNYLLNINENTYKNFEVKNLEDKQCQKKQ